MNRDEIVEAARAWKGVKWAHMGRNRMGVDCVGLVVKVAEHFGISHHGSEGNYRRTPQGDDSLVRILTSQMDIKRPPLKFGMVVILRDTTQPCHVGIIGERYGELSLIHASVLKREVYEEPWKYWSPRFRMALDYPGVED